MRVEMEIEIRNKPLMHGFSETAVNKDYAGTAFKLMETRDRIGSGKLFR